MNAMKKWTAACITATSICTTSILAAETTPQAKTPVAASTVTVAPVQTVDAARVRLSGVQAAIATLDAQIAAPAPRSLTAAQQAEWKEHGAWLSSVRQRYATFLAENGGSFGDTPGVSGADMAKRMAQMNMQFLALQEATQMESRRFQTLSNASKARHDIALNAIRNMK